MWKDVLMELAAVSVNFILNEDNLEEFLVVTFCGFMCSLKSAMTMIIT